MDCDGMTVCWDSVYKMTGKGSIQTQTSIVGLEAVFQMGFSSHVTYLETYFVIMDTEQVFSLSDGWLQSSHSSILELLLIWGYKTHAIR